MPVSGLTLRLVKGSALDSAEMDENLTILRDAINALEQLFLTVLNSDGTLKSGAINSASIIADGIITAAKLAADAKMRPGTIVPYGGSSVPAGFLACDGAAVNRTTYADLFAIVGTTWGAGDGSTTFNVPDLQGRSPMGDGSGAGLTARTLGTKTGAETHTLTTAEIPSHSHSEDARTGTGAGGSGGAAWTGVTSGSTGSTGGGGAHANVHPVTVVKFLIKT